MFFEVLLERLPLDILHGDVRRAVDLARVVHVAHVRMVNPRSGLTIPLWSPRGRQRGHRSRRCNRGEGLAAGVTQRDP